MHKRDTVCFSTKKSVKNPYDPQIAAAAQAQTRIAERSLDFSEQFYNENVVPMMEEMMASSRQQRGNQNLLFDLQYDQALKARDRFDRFGIPAEQAYYSMVQGYAEPEYAERFAQEQLGDTRTAFGTAAQTLNRRNAAMGIDPTSGASMFGRRELARDQAIAEAAALTRARKSAKDLGISLVSDAANYGRGGGSQLTQFGAGAGTASTSAFGIANQALSGTNASAGVPLQGMSQAGTMYGNVMSNYTSAGNTAMQANASAGGGIGGMLGNLAGIGLSKWIGG